MSRLPVRLRPICAGEEPFLIHVEKVNLALRLYQRLGFAIVDDRGVYWFMEWAQCAAPPLSRLGVSGRGDQVSLSFSDRMMKGEYDV